MQMKNLISESSRIIHDAKTKTAQTKHIKVFSQVENNHQQVHKINIPTLYFLENN